MPPKPNFKHQRAERDRAKKTAKEMKLQERAQRKSSDSASGEPEAEPGPNTETGE